MSRSPPKREPVAAAQAENVLKGLIRNLNSPLSPPGSNRASSSGRYGDVRDSLESSEGHTGAGGGHLSSSVSSLSPSSSLSPASKMRSRAKGASKTSSPSPSPSKASPNKGSGAGAKVTSPKLSPRSPPKDIGSKGLRDSQAAALAAGATTTSGNLAEESSMESLGGPGGNLDGGEEVYDATSKSSDNNNSGNTMSMSMSLGKTIRGGNGFQSALGGMGDDFADDFDDDEYNDDYDEGFASEEEEEEGGDSGVPKPTASPSSPTSGNRRGRGKKNTKSADDSLAMSDASHDMSFASDYGKNNSNKLDDSAGGYGSDDFEMMDYENDDKVSAANRRRVRFPRDSVVSDVFVTRDKYSGEQVEELFYTQDEAMRFSLAYSKESMQAEMAGQTWYDWWQDRDEDDVLKDEQEEEARRGRGGGDWYADDDFEDDFELEEEIASMEEEIEEVGEDSNEFNNF